MKDHNFEVRNEKVENILRNTGRAIKSSLPEGMGFALLLFDYTDNGYLFYCSSAERESMIKVMKEFINKNQP